MSDPLEEILDLEDRFYQQGHAEGLADGSRAGLIEGRTLGMQNGFDKFLECGRLAAKALVWANRLPPPSSAACSQASPSNSQHRPPDSEHSPPNAQHSPSKSQCSSSNSYCSNCTRAAHSSHAPASRVLPPLARSSTRLDGNIRSLYALVEPATLSTLNTDEAVNDVDDRIRRARGKLKVVERLVK